MEKGIQNVYVLGEDEGLILRAIESFTDDVSKLRTCILIRHKCTYVFGHKLDCYAKLNCLCKIAERRTKTGRQMDDSRSC